MSPCIGSPQDNRTPLSTSDSSSTNEEMDTSYSQNPQDTPKSLNISTSSTSTIRNMSWDHSPEQYALQEEALQSDLDIAITPRELFSTPTPMEQFDDLFDGVAFAYPANPQLRIRKQGVSENVVTRSNAFRDKSTLLDDGYLASPSSAGNDSSLDEAMEAMSVHLMDLIDSSSMKDMVPKNSKQPLTSSPISRPVLPCPLDPYDVKLDAVNNVTEVADQARQHLDTLDTVPLGPDAPVVVLDRTGLPQLPRRSRRTLHRHDYKRFHTHGTL